VLVCSNEREDGTVCCGDLGSSVFKDLKAHVAETQDWDVWVTETSCLGWCSVRGATVAVYPEGCFYQGVQDYTDLLSLLEDTA